MGFIEILLFGYCFLAVMYVAVFSFSGKLISKKKLKEINQPINKIALLVPAYKEDNIIYSVAKSLLEINYSNDYYDIIILADSLQKNTLQKLNSLPLKLVEVKFEKSTKAKSLNYAFEYLDDIYDIAIISDADNIMEKDFLRKINKAYNNGYKAIQGRRVAKNLNTPFAILDAASEIINNHIFRRGFSRLGCSSSLIGSGMAFNYQYLKKKLAKINAIGGFDKELQLAIVADGHKILYLEDALIYDEKVEKPDTFENQRRRWISSQFIYLKKYMSKGFGKLFKGNFDYFNIGVLCNFFLSRLLTLGFLVFIGVIVTITEFLFPKFLFISMTYWWGLLGIYIISLLIALPIKFYNWALFKAILDIPYAFILLLSSLLRIKGANKQFIHTIHTQTEIDNSLFNNEN